jgi:hypothetical protein
LEASGTAPDVAATKAIDEIGDIHALIDSVGHDARPSNPGETATALLALNRVKPNVGYVVRTVLLSVLLAGGIALVGSGAILGAFKVAPFWLVYSLPVESVFAGLFLAVIVADALGRETSRHYPTSQGRALGFGLAAFAALTGLGLVATWTVNPLAWLLVTGCALALASLIAFIAFGVTQTNRQKPWVLELNRSYAFEDRFSKDPAAAARFGIYTVVIWVLGFGAFAALSIAVGFAWSWLALVAALVVFFLVLARMLFGEEARKK